jgi:hypothetical protein
MPPVWVVDELGTDFSDLSAFSNFFLERESFFVTQFDLFGEAVVVVGHTALLHVVGPSSEAQIGRTILGVARS